MLNNHRSTACWRLWIPGPGTSIRLWVKPCSGRFMDAAGLRAAEKLSQVHRATGMRFARWSFGIVSACALVPALLSWMLMPSRAQVLQARQTAGAAVGRRAQLSREGGRIELRHCGAANRLCVRVDRKSPFYGENCRLHGLEGILRWALWQGARHRVEAATARYVAARLATRDCCVDCSGAAGPSSGAQLTLAGKPISRLDETKHFKMIGTTGTGKSTAIRELLAAALERGDRAVIADPDGGYCGQFFDSWRGDRVLNPFEARSARWEPLAELEDLADPEHLASALIATSADAAASEWRGYARAFVAAVLERCRMIPGATPAELWRLIAVASAEELRPLLAGTPAQPFPGSGQRAHVRLAAFHCRVRHAAPGVRAVAERTAVFGACTGCVRVVACCSFRIRRGRSRRCVP